MSVLVGFWDSDKALFKSTQRKGLILHSSSSSKAVKAGGKGRDLESVTEAEITEKRRFPACFKALNPPAFTESEPTCPQ